METLTTFLSLFISAVIPVLLYALKRTGMRDFIVPTFFDENRYRFAVSFLLMLSLSIGLNFVPSFQDIFATVGIGTSGTSLAMLDAAVGGLTVGVMRARK